MLKSAIFVKYINATLPTSAHSLTHRERDELFVLYKSRHQLGSLLKSGMAMRKECWCWVMLLMFLFSFFFVFVVGGDGAFKLRAFIENQTWKMTSIRQRHYTSNIQHSAYHYLQRLSPSNKFAHMPPFSGVVTDKSYITHSLSFIG